MIFSNGSLAVAVFFFVRNRNNPVIPSSIPIYIYTNFQTLQSEFQTRMWWWLLLSKLRKRQSKEQYVVFPKMTKW